MDSNDRYKTVLRLSYLYNDNPLYEQDGIYILKRPLA